jgi:hypothetical protein
MARALVMLMIPAARVSLSFLKKKHHSSVDDIHVIRGKSQDPYNVLTIQFDPKALSDPLRWLILIVLLTLLKSYR